MHERARAVEQRVERRQRPGHRVVAGQVVAGVDDQVRLEVGEAGDPLLLRALAGGHVQVRDLQDRQRLRARARARGRRSGAASTGCARRGSRRRSPRRRRRRRQWGGRCTSARSPSLRVPGRCGGRDRLARSRHGQRCRPRSRRAPARRMSACSQGTTPHRPDHRHEGPRRAARPPPSGWCSPPSAPRRSPARRPASCPTTRCRRCCGARRRSAARRPRRSASAGRAEQAAREQAEGEVLAGYLPAQLDDADLAAIVADVDHPHRGVRHEGHGQGHGRGAGRRRRPGRRLDGWPRRSAASSADQSRSRRRGRRSPSPSAVAAVTAAAAVATAAAAVHRRAVVAPPGLGRGPAVSGCRRRGSGSHVVRAVADLDRDLLLQDGAADRRRAGADDEAGRPVAVDLRRRWCGSRRPAASARSR